MATLSDPTVALLAELGADTFTRSDLDTLLLRADLAQYDPPGLANNKKDLLLRHLREAKSNADWGDEANHRALLSFTLLLVKQLDRSPATVGAERTFDALHQSLLSDGYRLATDSTGAIVLLPTEPSAAPLDPEITALEAELGQRGYALALTHYRQAVAELVNQQYETANGALRTALEDLVTRLAEDHTGYVRAAGSTGEPRADQGGAAITHMVDTSRRLPVDDGGMMLRGLWRMLSTNGPHPGQSDADEARWRMELVTATARFLLKHFPAKS